MRLWALAALLALATLARADRIAGRVVDAAGQAVPNAIVIATDAKTGLPLGPAGSGPFDDLKNGQLAKIQHATTDPTGAFSFDNIPQGEYRLIAQTWIDARTITDVTAPNARVIQLNGIADTVSVPSPEALKVEIKPLGTGQIEINLEAANDEIALLISTSPPGDAILSIASWKGPFIANLIGYNRMPRGATTIKGLPPGQVWMSIWYFGRQSWMSQLDFNLKPAQEVGLNNDRLHPVPDPRHGEPVPGERLRPIYVSLQKEDNYKSAIAVIKDKLANPKGTGLWALWNAPLEQEVELADGTKATVGDLLACMKYVALRRQWKLQQDQK